MGLIANSSCSKRVPTERAAAIIERSLGCLKPGMILQVEAPGPPLWTDPPRPSNLAIKSFLERGRNPLQQSSDPLPHGGLRQSLAAHALRPMEDFSGGAGQKAEVVLDRGWVLSGYPAVDLSQSIPWDESTG